ncbi:hypothetical protein DFH08DRAFT_888158 [Mycena albidolilacea]|uniref:Uncharacterized protein n=1 Tax=Mycena albidolilacea TaxID=1033008 RepID=A0AAD6ZI85_9AGAR|nr:hypothetical protein DFH08DRAFT_888158 [Mycena albidolilacea]
MTSESLNLHSLVSSLPAHSLNATAEKELLDNFKAAALSITTLYRSSRHASKRAYNAGYAAACRDLMEMLQLGVSDSHTLVPDRNQEAGMTIGRVMDWVEARLDAVRSREEEEDEEDERERGSHSSAPNASASGSHRPSAPARKPSPSPPPPSRVTAGPSSPPRSSIPLKSTRTLPQSKPTTSTVPAPPVPTTEFHVHVPTAVSFPFVENLPPPVTGSKRRHAIMMMPPPNSSPQSTPSSSSSPLPPPRRRTRSTRGLGLFPHNRGEGMDGMMDIEEDGRERKRVARR